MVTTVDRRQSSGPLAGVRVVEAGGIGPGPFCGMVLADMGADVVRVERPAGTAFHVTKPALFSRGKRYVELDLKTPADMEALLDLIDRADVLLEAFRPGVAERLGFGPDVCLARNPGLVYARQTGFGQSGAMSDRAGHDINYIALSGVLGLVGRDKAEAPVPPLNLVGDFGGGGLTTAYGIVCALFERTRSGLGQVVDGAIVDGSAVLATMFYDTFAKGGAGERGSGGVDGASPTYDSYETADGGWIAIGAVEPQFYAELLDCLGLAQSEVPDRDDRSQWPALRALFAEVFRSRSRAEWEKIFADRDACATPVLALAEAFEHPHNVERGIFDKVGTARLPAPAPKLSRTPAPVHAVEAEATVDEVRDGWSRPAGAVGS